MPRRPRILLPGHPQHVVVRGHNRDPIVVRKVDYQTLVAFLNDTLSRYDVALHAWVLMTNHIHLLLTPHELYLELGRTDERRHQVYRSLFDGVPDLRTLEEFRRGMRSKGRSQS